MICYNDLRPLSRSFMGILCIGAAARLTFTILPVARMNQGLLPRPRRRREPIVADGDMQGAEG